MEENKDDATQPAFEQRLKRLEDIVKRLEQGEIALAQSLELFEEGTKLNQQLAQTLDAAEARIEKLTRRPDGTLTTENLSPRKSHD